MNKLADFVESRETLPYKTGLHQFDLGCKGTRGFIKRVPWSLRSVLEESQDQYDQPRRAPTSSFDHPGPRRPPSYLLWLLGGLHTSRGLQRRSANPESFRSPGAVRPWSNDLLIHSPAWYWLHSWPRVALLILFWRIVVFFSSSVWGSIHRAPWFPLWRFVCFMSPFFGQIQTQTLFPVWRPCKAHRSTSWGWLRACLPPKVDSQSLTFSTLFLSQCMPLWI